MTKASETYPQIVALIRSGKKTSEIIALGKWDVATIKAVKSEELLNDKKVERANLEAQTQRANEAREIRQNDRFMAKYNLNKESPAITDPGADVTFSAPALGADAQQ